MIEQDIEHLEEVQSETNKILYFILRKIQKSTEPHSKFCIDREREILQTYGYITGHCACDSELINDTLNFRRVPILDEEEIKTLEKEFKKKKKK